jgi:hypothetical protein
LTFQSIDPDLQVIPKSYATSSTPPAKSTTNLAYVALGIAAAAGSYWYYTHPEDAKAQQKDILRKGHQSVDAVKASADGAYQRGQTAFDESKVGFDLATIFILINLPIGIGQRTRQTSIGTFKCGQESTRGRRTGTPSWSKR